MLSHMQLELRGIDLVIEVFGSPFWHQVLFELSVVAVSLTRWLKRPLHMRLTLQISLLVEQRLQRTGKSIAEGWKMQGR